MNTSNKALDYKLVSITVCYGLGLAVITIFLYHYLEQRDLISPRSAFVSTVAAQISFMIMAQIHTLRLGNTNIIKLFLVGICCFLLAEFLWQLVEVSQQENLTIYQGFSTALQYGIKYAPLIAVSAALQVSYVNFFTWYKQTKHKLGK